MLTLKLISEQTDHVIKGLEKKHFKDAKETIQRVLDIDKKRRASQTELDKNLSEANSLSKTIGTFMKEGKKEEAEKVKARVSELKDLNKGIQEEMEKAQKELTALLYTIPNIP